jgi:uncharacterized membrane protein YhaH (DUF805 family)
MHWLHRLSRPETFAMSLVWLLFRVDGRLNRARYWLTGLLTLCAALTLAAVLAFVVAGMTQHVGKLTLKVDPGDVFLLVDLAAMRRALETLSTLDLTSPATLVPLLCRLILSPLLAWVFIATSVKRLHDRDRSGWWLVLFFGIPHLYSQFADDLGDSYAAIAIGLAAIVLYIWGLIELLFLKGTHKSNRFGPDPLLARPVTHTGRTDAHFRTPAPRAT